MTKQELQVEEVKNQQDLMTFIRFPWEIYQGDPYWVPPLIKDQLSKFSPNHPFSSHSEMIFFLAYRGGKVVGRIVGIIDHHYIEFHQEKVGFFGFFGIHSRCGSSGNASFKSRRLVKRAWDGKDGWTDESLYQR